jgi:hypothetical protein
MKRVKIKFYKNKFFFINIVIGLVISVTCHFIENTRFGIKNLDYIFDMFILNESVKYQANVNLDDIQQNISKDIVFIDLKYTNYKKWNFPFITPRDVLANIISIADSAGAKIIIPDFFFDYYDYKSPANDDSLRHVLKRIVSAKHTKIILPAIIGMDRHLKPNIFDDLLEKYDNIYSALPTVVASGHDDIIRYSEDYDLYIKSTEHNETRYSKIYSIPLAISKVLKGISIKNNFVNNNTDIFSEIAEKKQPENYLYKKRIRFFIVPGNETDSTIRTGNIPVEQYFLIDNIIPQYLKDKIVVVGSSNPESNDNHVTPIGKIPGLYILGNAINTEIMQLYPKEVSLFTKYFVEILVIIIASYLFLVFHELVARILTSIILLILLGGINYYIFYSYGVFINFILPVLGIGFHRIISSFEILLLFGIKKDH